MKTKGSIDYSSSYFKYKASTPIRGEPTNKNLKQLRNEQRANGNSVESYLGGGDHVYIGLIEKDSEYSKIPGTQPFLPPNYPQEFNTPADATAIQAMQLKEAHREAK